MRFQFFCRNTVNDEADVMSSEDLCYCVGQQLFLTLSLLSVSVMNGMYEMNRQYCKLFNAS